MFKFKLIDEARASYKFASMIITGFLAVMAFLQANFGLVTMFVPAAYLPWLVMVIAIAAMIGRLLKQEGPSLEGKYKKYEAILDQMRKLFDQVRSNPDLAKPVEESIMKKIDEKKEEADRIAAKITVESKGLIDLPFPPAPLAK